VGRSGERDRVRTMVGSGAARRIAGVRGRGDGVRAAIDRASERASSVCANLEARQRSVASFSIIRIALSLINSETEK
jgi:hypothetical protein